MESVEAYGNNSLYSQQVCTKASESIYSQFPDVLTFPCWFASWMNASWHICDQKRYPNKPKIGFSCCQGPSHLIFAQNTCCKVKKKKKVTVLNVSFCLLCLSLCRWDSKAEGSHSCIVVSFALQHVLLQSHEIRKKTLSTSYFFLWFEK